DADTDRHLDMRADEDRAYVRGLSYPSTDPAEVHGQVRREVLGNLPRDLNRYGLARRDLAHHVNLQDAWALVAVGNAGVCVRQPRHAQERLGRARLVCRFSAP